jgi:hypothetical protein
MHKICKVRGSNSGHYQKKKIRAGNAGWSVLFRSSPFLNQNVNLSFGGLASWWVVRQIRDLGKQLKLLVHRLQSLHVFKSLIMR